MDSGFTPPMIIKVLVFKSKQASLDFPGSCGTGRKPPLSVRGDSRSQQLTVAIGDNGRIGYVKKLSGKAKDISCHQKSDKNEYCFSGDG